MHNPEQAHYSRPQEHHTHPALKRCAISAAHRFAQYGFRGVRHAIEAE